MYDGPIIDPHQHFWDVSMGCHPWLSASGATAALGGLEAIRHNFLPPDYRRDAARQNIVATVHIEALWRADDPVGETRWLETLDKPGRLAARYTAAAPLGTPRGAAILEQQAAVARVAAIRQVLSFHPVEPARSFAPHGEIASDPAWRQDVARLPALGLSLELMMYPYQLQQVLEVARALPNLQIIVNHCASPVDRDADGMARWRNSVALLAREPNVALKVSNAAAYDPTPTFESLSAVVRYGIEQFGTARTMLATDWPVARIWLGFDETYDMLRRATADLSASEQRALFHDNAARLYGISNDVVGGR